MALLIKISKDKISDREVNRFLTKVDRSQGLDKCWIFKGYKDNEGYGQFDCKINNEDVYTRFKSHRLSHLIFHGELDDKLYVCHRCNNSSCCNPTHLYQGTQQQNIADKKQEGSIYIERRNGLETAVIYSVVRNKKRHTKTYGINNNGGLENAMKLANEYKINYLKSLNKVNH